MFSYKHLNLYINKNEEITFALFAILLFLTPIILPTQFLVGTIVNALFISIALKQKNNLIFILSIIPSLAVTSTGLLFGELNFFILIMIPFITLSNILLMFFIRRIKNYFNSSIIAILSKTLILSTSVFVLFTLDVIPFTLVPIFSLFQLITAFSGAVVIGFLKK